MFFFFNDTATTEIYTLSLHDALPICSFQDGYDARGLVRRTPDHHHQVGGARDHLSGRRSEEHTSELQSQSNLVCRLLLEKKKKSRPPGTPMAVNQIPCESSVAVATAI